MKHNNRTKFISITLSVALISALGLGGCGSSTETKNEQVTTSALNLNQQQGYNSISGKTILDESTNSKIRTLTKSQADITAYNLDDNTIYKTTTDINGNYELSGLSDGEYQIIAENDKYAKSAAQRVTLKKGSRAVVDFSLTAAGTVSGKIAGAGFVFIPGTDHVSVTDGEGNFALTGVPVGTYTLMFEADDSDERGSIDITISAGAVTTIDQDSGFSSDSHYDEFGYVDTSLELGVLQLQHEGLAFRINNLKLSSEMYPQLSKYISIKNSAGEEVDFHIDFDYDRYKATIKTDDLVAAGTYTLTFSKELSELLYDPIDSDKIYTFTVDNISVAMPSVNAGSRMLKIILPTELTDEQKNTLKTLQVKEKGVATPLTLKSSWGNNALLLFGSFKTGVEYEVVATDDQKAILGTLKSIDDKLVFGEVKIDDIYPSNNAENININQNLYVNVDFANELDPSTIKFILNSHEYKGKDILFNGDTNYYDDDYHSSRVNISFKHDKLNYDTDYTLEFSAKDMSGNNITTTTTFKTMKPSIVEMEPERIEDLFDEMQMIRFNVPVDPQSGTITIENLTDSSTIATIERDDHEYSYDPYEIFFRINSLTPNQRYKVTASGFKDKDGVAIADKTTEFSTPPRMLFIPDQYSQNINVSGENFSHKVNLFFFGGLTDSEKATLEDNLLVTSYGETISVDETHPVRKLFFIEQEDGTMVTVAFTIDPETNYELTLSDASGLADIILPDNTKLVSFSTTRSGTTSNDINTLKVVESLSVQKPYLMEDYDQSTGKPSIKLLSNINMDIKLPLGYIKYERDEYGNTKYISCWDKFRNFANPDIANSLIKDSLTVTNGNNNNIDVTVTDTSWSIEERWIGNDTRICYARNNNYQPIAYFEADYDKSYNISLNLTDNLESDVSVTNTNVTKTLQTAPVGTVDFYLTDGNNISMQGESTDDNIKESREYEPYNMIMVHIEPNAPMKTENIDDLLNIKVNGADFEPEYYFDTNEMNVTNDIAFAIPRTLYSLVQVEISKADGQDMVFINPITNEEVTNNSSLEKPVVLVEDVAPDLLPVKVEEVQTTSMQNNEIVVNFNRPVNPADVATVDDNGAISDIAFEVKANDGETVDIDGIEGTYDGVRLGLSKELNTSKTYTLSLKDGKSIKAAFGAQELKEFSQEIPLTYIEVGQMINLYKNGLIENDTSNPYILDRTDKIYANYNSQSAVLIPVTLADGTVLDIDKSNITAKYAYNDQNILNNGSLEYDAQNNMLIQPISNEYNINVNADIVYTAQGQERTVERSQYYLNRIELPYVSWYYGNGQNAITFGIANMADGYPISSDNFIVYNVDGEKINADITIQFNNMDNYEPTVSFGSLDPDTVYAVEIVGIPSYNISPDILNDFSIDRIFIKTLPTDSEPDSEPAENDKEN